MGINRMNNSYTKLLTVSR